VTVPRVPVLRARMRTRVETAAHARRAGETTFFRHHAMTARTGAGILAAASLDARSPPLRLARAPRAPLLMIPRGPRQLSSGAGDLVRLQLLVAAAAAVYGERERERERERESSVCGFVTAVLLARPPPTAAAACLRGLGVRAACGRARCASSAFYPRAFCEIGRGASTLACRPPRPLASYSNPHRSRPMSRPQI